MFGDSQASFAVDNCTSYCVPVIENKFVISTLHNGVQTCKYRLIREDNDFGFGSRNGGRSRGRGWGMKPGFGM